MEMYHIPEISEGVFSVGVKDWNRRVFDALIPIPHGTSYNAYLIKGRDRTALIDTVNRGFENEFIEKVSQVLALADLDYVVMNHAESDHAGALSAVLQASNHAKLVTTDKGAKAAQVYYGIPMEKMRIVRDGETLDLGDKTLKFIHAPWLHWPETMFTYLIEDRILFPCDFLGAHTAQGIYQADVKELVTLAKTYFGEIMMPFRHMGQKALEKVSTLDIRMIAPGHGPIYTSPQEVLEAYKSWTAGETREKAIVVYVSMLGSTEAMVKTLIEALRAEGIEASVHNLANADLGDIARELVDSRALVLGSPTVLGGMHPLAGYATFLIKMFKPPLKYCVLLGSHGFGGGALPQALEHLDKMKIEIVGTLEVNGPPSLEDREELVSMGKALAARIKGMEVQAAAQLGRKRETVKAP